MQAVKLTDKVWWVGAIDWGLRDFHGYATDRGSTYNAFLVLSDKVTLIDTVKAPFKDEMMMRITSIVDPAKIDYIISNHSEMDHSGCLPEVMAEVKPEKVFASANGIRALEDHFHKGLDIIPVKDGESIDLGGMRFTFYETKMLHWPDSMMSYLSGEEILFSQDGFGMHLASSQRFDDEIDMGLLEYEAAKYYANILTPFSQMVGNVLKKLKSLNLPIKMIAPDHGPVWRKSIGRILELYSRWVEQRPVNKAVIVFDTMWQSTAHMARAISDGLSSSGVATKVMPLHGSHRSDVATELIESGAFVVGSPTINNQIFPTVADVLTYVKGLKFKNLVGAVFGSYGWSGESVKQLKAILGDMKVDPVGEVAVKYVPREEDIKACYELGLSVADKLKDVLARQT